MCAQTRNHFFLKFENKILSFKEILGQIKKNNKISLNNCYLGEYLCFYFVYDLKILKFWVLNFMMNI